MPALIIVFCVGIAGTALSNPNLKDLTSVKTDNNSKVNMHHKGATFNVNISNPANSRTNTATTWRGNGFSNKAGETIKVQQPTRDSSFLARSHTQSASRIFGNLQSNGKVLLLNPNGVIFGPNSAVDVQGLIASSLNLSNADFFAGNYNKFTNGTSPGGALLNQGVISTPLGGQVWLIGGTVQNDGVITTPKGRVMLAAGNSATFADTAAPDISVTVSGDGKSVNLGEIAASGGVIDIYGALIDQKGVLKADSQTVDQQGRIRLVAKDTVRVSGKISTVNNQGRGGKIQVSGDNILLANTAHIDASGRYGGGVVHVGGGWRGKDKSITNSRRATKMQKGALIQANAGERGDGGEVVLWSDGSTDFKGQIRVLGGSQGGDGGRVETSGKQRFRHGGQVNAGAYRGQAGLWLIDPAKLCFQNTGSSACAADANTDIWTNDEIETALSNTYPADKTAPTVSLGDLVFAATDQIDIYDLDLSNSTFIDKDIVFETSAANSVINVFGQVTGPGTATGTPTERDADWDDQSVQITSEPTDNGNGTITFTGTKQRRTTTSQEFLDLTLKAAAVNISGNGNIRNLFVHFGTDSLNGNTVGSSITRPSYLDGKVDAFLIPGEITETTTRNYSKTVNVLNGETVDQVAWTYTGQTGPTTTTESAYEGYESATFDVATSIDTQQRLDEICNTNPALCGQFLEHYWATGQLLSLTSPSSISLSGALDQDSALAAFVIDAGATRQQLLQAQRLRHAHKTEAFKGALEVLEREPSAADVPTCGAGDAGSLCIPDPQETRALALQRAATTPIRQPKSAFVPQIRRKIAVVIGINDYQDQDVPDLQSPLRDIEAIGNEMQQKLGYEVQPVINGSKAQIIQAIAKAAREAGPDDSVAIYYAGHGYLTDDTKQGYWIPSDGKVGDPSNWISNRDVSRLMAAIPAKQVVLISDSCFSGSLVQGVVTPNSDQQQLLNRRSVTVLTSGSEEPVSDLGRDGHSIFAWSMLQQLRNVNSVERGGDFFQQLRQTVSAAYPQTPEYGASISAGYQAGGDYLLEQRVY